MRKLSALPWYENSLSYKVVDYKMNTFHWFVPGDAFKTLTYRNWLHDCLISM